MRVLVTGASGFVGKHLLAALRAHDHLPIAAGRPGEGDAFLPLEITDADAVRDCLSVVQPEAVIHLAAQASVPAAIADPQETARINAGGTLNLLEAIRATEPSTRLVFISSAEVYGIQPREHMPLAETLAPQPANPYAASKAAAEAYVTAWARTFGANAVIARAFNHIGPGQDQRFVVGSFARQLAAIAAGAEAKMFVGNLEAERDFLDVRDVVEAYVALLERGDPGEAYNICAGRAVSIKEVLRILVTIARVPVEIREDPERMRPSDVPLLLGDARKLRDATGWAPRIALNASLRDIYADAQARLAAAEQPA